MCRENQYGLLVGWQIFRCYIQRPSVQPLHTCRDADRLSDKQKAACRSYIAEGQLTVIIPLWGHKVLQQIPVTDFEAPPLPAFAAPIQVSRLRPLWKGLIFCLL